MQQPGRVVFHTKVAAELQRGDASLGLADQIEAQEPSSERQLLLRRSLWASFLHDRAGRERCLMAAAALTARKDDASAADQVAMANVAG